MSADAEKIDLKDPLRTFIGFITQIAQWEQNNLPITEVEINKQKLEEATKKLVNGTPCSDCGEALIINARTSMSGKRKEMFGTTYCPKCKVTNQYRRFLN